MKKTLEELNILAQEYGFSGAHNAITCASEYRKAYSNYLEKYQILLKKVRAIAIILEGMIPEDELDRIGNEFKKESNE